VFGRHNIQYGGKHGRQNSQIYFKNVLLYKNVVVT